MLSQRGNYTLFRGALLLVILGITTIVNAQSTTSACEISAAKEVTDLSQTRTSNTIMQWRAGAFAQKWQDIDLAAGGEEGGASVLLPGIRRSEVLCTANFGFQLSQGSVINKITIEVTGAASGAGIATTLMARLVDGPRSYISPNIASTERPSNAAWNTEYEDSTFTWRYTYIPQGTMTSEVVNDPNFGFGIEARNIISDSINLRVDNVNISIDYTPLYSICSHPCATFFVDKLEPNVASYQWQVPPGFKEISGGKQRYIIDIEKTYASNGVHTICVDKTYNDGSTQTCCRDIVVEDCGLATIGDEVFVDMNADGVRDQGEEGLANVQIELRDGNGALQGSTFTNADGLYGFVDIIPAEYYVVFTPPLGYMASRPGVNNKITQSRGKGTTDLFLLLAGDSLTTIDAAFAESVTIGDFVWEDINGNSIQDADDLPLANIGIQLSDGLQIISQVMTDAEGRYLFEDLLPGNYVIEVMYGDSLVPVSQDAGPDDIDSDLDSQDQIIVFGLPSSAVDLSFDAGFSRLGSIGDVVFNDVDNDGTQSPVDVGLEGIVITLLRDGVEVATTTSGVDGSYIFEDLPSGTYVVAAEAPQDLVVAKPNIGDPTSDNDLIATGNELQTVPFQLLSGEDRTDIDLGFRPELSDISGVAWRDTEYDGLRQMSEAPLSNVMVSLYTSAGDLLRSTTTDTDGAYTFDQVFNGDYYVVFGAMPGHVYTISDAGSDDIDSDVTSSQQSGSTDIFTLLAGIDKTTIDAGYAALSSVGDFVWNDLNGNGLQDTGEPGIEGVKVQLINSLNQHVGLVFTDGDGLYRFDGLVAGTYLIAIDIPDGFDMTLQDAGDDTLDSDADAVGHLDIEVDGNGLTVLTYDFGLIEYASVGDFVWLDVNNDGIQDAGDQGISDVAVSLVSNGTTIATTTSDASGAYRFDDVIAGDYSISVVTPMTTQIALTGTGASSDEDSDLTMGGAEATTDNFTLLAGVDRSDIDLGFRPELSDITGVAWRDTEYDGLRQMSEAPLSNVMVSLYTNTGDLLRSTTTDTDGVYTFDQVFNGDYYVVFGAMPGHVYTISNAGPDDIDSDVTSSQQSGSTDIFTLEAGVDITTIDAGYAALSSVGDFVWNDEDGNGEQGTDEPGIAGVEVRLLDATSQQVDFTVTDVDGLYRFDGLLAGDYTIAIDIPTGFDVTLVDATADNIDNDANQSGEITLSIDGSGSTDLSNDFGLIAYASVGDFVWLDVNNDGIQDAGDQGISDVAVSLVSNGTTIATTTSDASGAYRFDDVIAGDYSISVVTPMTTQIALTGTGASSDEDSDLTMGGAEATTDNFTLLAGQNRTDIDLGFRPELSDISGVAWRDTEYDGLRQMSEAPLSNVMVSLYTSTGDLLRSTTTDTDGAYTFDQVFNGDYYVVFGAMPGHVYTISNAGPDDIDSDVTSSQQSGSTDIFTLEAGVDITTIDAGYAALSSVGDFVWNDEDGNGEQGTDEPGIAGVEVRLLDATSQQVDFTVTDADGLYRFDGLLAGDYTIAIDIPTGFDVTLADATADNIDNDANALGEIAITIDGSGSTDLSNDFGLIEYASVGDFVWLDVNNDGMQDAGDQGISDVVVSLVSNGTTIATTTSDATGAYRFDGVIAGDYSISVVTPMTTQIALTGTGASSDTDSDLTMGGADATTDNFTLLAGVDRTDIDLGFRPELSDISGVAWRDTEYDGLRQMSEAPLSNVMVSLYTSTGDLLRSTTTDTDGAYTFDQVFNGDYYVVFGAMPGHVYTISDAGSDDIDSDVTSSQQSGSTDIFTLEAGVDITTIDAGYAALSSVGDFVWNDEDGNGEQGTDEPGIAGVEVRLLDATSQQVDFTVTDADGLYRFDGLLAGDYTIAINIPTGFDVTLADATADNIDNDANQSGEIPLSIDGSGSTDLTNDIGLIAFASVGDFVWLDVNNDGIQDAGDQGISDVAVSLVSNGTTIATTTSDASGAYRFDDVIAGDYSISVLSPMTTDIALTGTGANTDLDSDLTSNGMTPSTDVFTLLAGQNRTDIDLGFRPALSSISGVAWRDTEYDGLRQMSEAPFSNVMVSLYTSTGDLLRSTTTDTDGAYTFDQVFNGDYYVVFGAMPGHVYTISNAGPDDIDSDVTSSQQSGSTDIFTLEAGVDITTIDAGYAALSSVGDFVWNDEDGNGEQGTDEPGIAGVEVRLLDASAQQVDFTVTDVDGLYRFDGLLAGDYTIAINIPTGFDVTLVDATADNIDNDANQSGEILLSIDGSGSTDLSNDFGLIAFASVGDFVWLDVNNDGMQDAGDQGISDVAVSLVSNGTTIATTTSDASGAYRFDDVIAGDYSISVATPMTTQIALTGTGASSDEDSDLTMGGAEATTDNFTLLAGQDRTDIDLGFRPELSNITGVAWRDTEYDGLRQMSEAPLSNVMVSLYTSTGDLLRSTTTDTDGAYTFDQVFNGDYYVVFGAMPGHVYTISDAGSDDIDSDVTSSQQSGSTDIFTLEAGVDITTIDAGYAALSSVGDFVWNDEDGNGEQGTDEPGIAGVEVRLLDATSQQVNFTVTDADGLYRFDGLLAGDYTIAIDIPTGFDVTLVDATADDNLDNDANALGEIAITIDGSGSTDLTNDIGLIAFASVGDFVWLDVNNDGMQDAGDQGISDVAVSLVSNGTTIATTTSDASGAYRFDDVIAGDYSISVVTPMTTQIALTGTGASSDTDSDLTMGGAEAATDNFSLLAGEDRTDIDLGFRPELSDITGVAWRDTEYDGLRQMSEAPLSNVMVSLYTSTGDLLRSTTTNTDGAYTFDQVFNGDYYVVFGAMPGHVYTISNAGPDDIDSDVTSSQQSGSTDIFTLEAGIDLTTIDAGYAALSSVGDFVWNDEDGNGEQGTDEPGIAGVEVRLSDASAQQVDFTVTDADGLYRFDGLLAGDYTIAINIPTGFDVTLADATDDNLDNDANALGEIAITIDGSGSTDLSNDFGLIAYASVGDFVWLDVNNDGMQDAGDQGISDVAVSLVSNGTTIATTTSDASGAYRFDDVIAGDYSISVLSPMTTDIALTGTGANTDLDSDLTSNGMTPSTDVFTLLAGQDRTDIDLGFRPGLSDITGVAWRDTEYDGLRQMTEAPLSNVMVSLYTSTGDLLRSTTTDTDGVYTFDQVFNGDYYVVFGAMPGHVYTISNAGPDDIDSDVTSSQQSGSTDIFTLSSAMDIVDIDAGYAALSSVGDFVWNDEDGNGEQGLDEPGIAGVEVRLLDASAQQVDFTVTDADGLYRFDGLLAGDYTIAIDIPTGFDVTLADATDDNLDNDANALGEIAITIDGSGSTDLTNDIGLIAFASVGDFVWLDVNNDGMQDAGDQGISDVAVSLVSNGTTIATTTSDASGAYRFDDVIAGDYSISVLSPMGLVIAIKDPLIDTDLDSDLTTAGSMPSTEIFTIVAGQNRSDIDLGFGSGTGSVSGVAWADTTYDGVRQGDELPLIGVAVELYQSSGQLVASTVTNQDGRYSFSDVLVGEYYLVFASQQDATYTLSDIGSNATDSDVTSSISAGSTDLFIITGGIDLTNVDAGYALQSSIGDFVWSDLDGDGVQDASEPGIEGIIITLLDHNGQIVASSVTNVDGLYRFDGLLAGDYTISVDLSNGLIVTIPDSTTDELDSDADLSGNVNIVVDGNGGQDFSYDIGLVALGSIGDYVWQDIDTDGLQDTDDLPLQGVEVYLVQDGNLVETTTSDSQGFYQFDEVLAGTYQVAVITPTGMVITRRDSMIPSDQDSDLTMPGNIASTDEFILEMGENRTDIDLGFTAQTSFIRGLAWSDLNADGIRQDAEPTMQSILVTLYNSAGNVVSISVTDPMGQYTFEQVLSGEYYVTFMTMADQPFTTPNVGPDDRDSDVTESLQVGSTDLFTVPPAVDVLNVDAGYAVLSSIGDFVWFDQNTNGIQDAGEPGIADVTIQLLDMQGAIIDTDLTNSEGEYLFEDIMSGMYMLQVTPPDGFSFTIANAGPDDVDSDADFTGLVLVDLDGNNATDLTYDIGLTGRGSIGDFVFEDINRNLTQDPSDLGFADQVVYLLRNGVRVDSTMTDSQGLYLFDNVPTGTYQIETAVPAQYGAIFDTGGNDDLDSDIQSSGQTALSVEFDLTSNQDRRDIDLGFVQMPAMIAGLAFKDVDGDGIYDMSIDTTLPGVSASLFNDAGNTVTTITTDADGRYEITDLMSGTYYLVWQEIDSLIFTFSDLGSDAMDSDVTSAIGLGSTDMITLLPGTDRTDVFAGYVLPGSIGDFVFIDLNRNGIQDAGDSGINDVQMTLYTLALDSITSVSSANSSTGDSGFYRFADLLPGMYLVGVDVQPPFMITAKNQGTDDSLDSDFEPIAGRTLSSPVVITPGLDRINVDAGLRPDFGSISGVVWQDADSDGLLAMGELPQAGITVDLLDAASQVVLQSDTTDVDGRYLFGSIDVGIYDVRFNIPGNATPTLMDQGSDELIDSDANLQGVVTDINIGFGTAVEGVNIGLVEVLESICGLVWEDANADGLRDTTELLTFAGQRLLLADTAGTILDTAITNMEGAYTFEGVGTGLFVIVYDQSDSLLISPPTTLPDSINNDFGSQWSLGSTDTIRVEQGDKIDAIDLGVFRYASIGDLVFLDLDEDGIQDNGENGVAAVTVKIYNDNGEEVQSVVTDSSGIYRLDSLIPGRYVIEVELPTFFVFGPADVGSDDAVDSDITTINGLLGTTDTLGVASDEDISTVDVALLDRRPESTTISGFVWEDADADGIREANESGVNLLAVALYRANGTLISTVTTAFNAQFQVDGYYEFTSLPMGDYFVVFSIPGDAFATEANATAENNDSDITSMMLPGSTDIVTIGTGIEPFSTDGGFYRNAEIQGITWYDFVQDGILDNEEGVNGVTVNLYDATSTLIATTVSDFDVTLGDGLFGFTDLIPGDYYLEFINQDGYLYTFADRGSDEEIDSDVTDAFGPGTTDLFSVTSGAVVIDRDAGLVFDPASVGDFVWIDFDGDGVQDSGEPGLNDVTVELYSALDDRLVATTTTSTNNNVGGFYQIDNVQPGDYYIVFTAPSDYLTSPNVTFDNTINSDIIDPASGSTDIFFVDQGVLVDDIDAGFYLPASLGDQVWEDLNENGLFDIGEPGVEGVTVQLFGVLPFPVASTITDVNGNYCFDDLRSGVYRIQVNLPSGFAFTQQNVGSDESIDSDVSSTGSTSLIALSHAVSLKDRDAGLVSVSNARVVTTIWEDLNDNGIQDAEEPRMAGVEVMLMDDQGQMTQMLVTDDIGLVSYTVNPIYGAQIRVMPMIGYTFSNADMGSNDAMDSDVDSQGYGPYMAPGSTMMNVDAGVVPFSTLGVHVWYDDDADGVYDKEDLPQAGVELVLRDKETGLAVGTATSVLKDSTSIATFHDVPRGQYYVELLDLQDLIVAEHDALGSDYSAFYYQESTPRSIDIELNDSMPVTEIGLGLYRGGSIETFVWEDVDNDAKLDDNDKGRPRMYVTLINEDTRMQRTRVTDAEGIAVFDDLPVGDYFLTYFDFGNPDFVLPNIGSEWTDSDVTHELGPGTTKLYTIPHDYTTTHISAGLRVDPTLADNSDHNDLVELRSVGGGARLYPNPTMEYVTLEYETDEPIKYQIFRTDGQIMLEGTVDSGDRVDVSTLPPAIYTIDMQSGSEQTVKLFIKL